MEHEKKPTQDAQNVPRFSPTQPRRAKTRRSAGKAAGELKPEAYPLGYVEDFDEPRTPLAGVFSILLLEHWLLLFKPLHLTLQFLHSIL